MEGEEDPLRKKILSLKEENLEATGVLLVTSNEKVTNRIRNLEEKLKEVRKNGKEQRRHLLKEVGLCRDELKELPKAKVTTQVLNKERELESQLTALKKELNKLREQTRSQNQLVRATREESEQLREDFIYEQVVEPGAKVLMALRDNVIGGLSELAGNESMRIFLEETDAQLRKALMRFGITEIELEGSDFDPSVQEVVKREETLEKRHDGKVVEILKPGYIRDEKLIRPQKVKVAKFNGGGSGGR